MSKGALIANVIGYGIVILILSIFWPLSLTVALLQNDQVEPVAVIGLFLLGLAGTMVWFIWAISLIS
jgi:hypothetical protein